MAITGVNSLLGFIFWIIAARLYSTHAVGLATALIAAMTLASTLSNVGIGSGLVQRLPTRSTAREWSLTLNVSLVVSVVSGLIAAIVTVAVLPVVSKKLNVVHTSPGYALVLVVGIVSWTVSTTMDFVFLSERKVKYGFVRNATMSLSKLVFVAAPLIVFPATALTLFATWIASVLVALAVAVRLTRRRLSRSWVFILSGIRAEMNQMKASLVGHYFINVGGILPMYLLPLIVTARLGVVQNAWAYIGWMVGGFALVVSPTVSASLFAEGSNDPEAFARQARRSLAVTAVLFIPMMAVVLLLAHRILGAFGPQYATHSYELVIVLVLSAIPDAITNIYVATLRVRGKLRAAAILNISMALSAVILAWFLVRSLGVAGIAWSWLIAQCAGSIFAILRVLAGRRDTREATAV